MKYECTVLIDACVNATIEADSPEEAAEKMEEHEDSSPRLCHQCAKEVNLGDPIGVIVNSEDGMTELLDTSLYGEGKKKAKEQAERIAELERQLAAAKKDSERIDAIEFFTREPDEWESKYGRCKNGDTWCWTFYAPKGVQGDTRRIIDAAIKAKEQKT